MSCLLVLYTSRIYLCSLWNDIIICIFITGLIFSDSIIILTHILMYVSLSYSAGLFSFSVNMFNRSWNCLRNFQLQLTKTIFLSENFVTNGTIWLPEHLPQNISSILITFHLAWKLLETRVYWHTKPKGSNCSLSKYMWSVSFCLLALQGSPVG